MSNNKYEQPDRCLICSAAINEDGTVHECYGECGREIVSPDKFEPLNFHDSPLSNEDIYDKEYEELSEFTKELLEDNWLLDEEEV
jgi:hypothetical protein